MSNPTLITFVIYIAAMILIGFTAYRATKNFDDYILGGRSIGSFVTALSAGASDMSGWLLMGLPGAIFVAGLSESWIAIGLIAGAWLNWLFVAGRLRVHTEHNHNALTLPDYFSHRFEDHSRLLRIFSALVILMFFTIYCASGVVAGARLFESTFGMEYGTALWVGAAATILYVFIGGFLAVSWTDTVQATLMIFALLITPLFVILALGDMGAAMETIAAQDPSNFDMFKGLSFIAIISLLGWGLGYFGQPHILVRFMAADSAVEAHDPQRRTGRHAGWRHHRGGLEGIHRPGPVRDYPRLPVRQHRDLRRQPDGQGAGCIHSAALRSGRQGISRRLIKLHREHRPGWGGAILFVGDFATRCPFIVGAWVQGETECSSGYWSSPSLFQQWSASSQRDSSTSPSAAS